MAEGGRDRNSGVADVMATSLSPGTSGSATLAEGENVNQNFTNCTVNVVAGNQINVNVYNNTSTEGEASTPSQEECSALVNIVNANTRQKTADKILDDFKTESLHRPDFQVNPRMRKIKVKDYFKGNYREVLATQLIKEIGFHGHKEQDTLSFDQLIMSITGETNSSHPDEHSVIGIVASAGSGKTTLMRRLARKSLDAASITQGPPNQVVTKMIHFIELKTIQYAGYMKPSTFLFGGLFRNESDEQNAYQWLLENQTNAVLYFDGLDQATWKIGNGTNCNEINPFSRADTASIMYNILSGNLFPHAKIVFASREFRVSELPAKARPSDIITLSGLTQNDAEKLFVFLIGEGGAEAWENIRSMSPRLLSLVSVPVFLILTAVVMARDPTRPPPNTVTELYRRIISALRHVDNIRQRDKIDEILSKLKKMAYRGMKEGRVVFYEEDLQTLGLSTEEVQDLIMKVPGNNLLSRHLIEGNFIFFFCHQSIQEFLAASFIAHMTAEEFSLFDENHLHENRWSVVRRFVSGLVHEQSTDQVDKIPDQRKKQRVFGRSIRSQLKKVSRSQESLLELYTTIYESDDDDLMKQLDVIEVLGNRLSREEAHVVGTIVARSRGLDWLYIIDDDAVFYDITKFLKEPVHVKKVSLFGKNISARALRSFLGHPRIEAWTGNLHWEELSLIGSIGWHNEGGDVMIRDAFGIDNKGRFNTEDYTLSLEENLPAHKVEFFEELFGVRSNRFQERDLRRR